MLDSRPQWGAVMRRGCALFLVMLPSLAACDEPIGVTLLFDRGATGLARPVFPTDQSRGEQVSAASSRGVQ